MIFLVVFYPTPVSIRLFHIIKAESDDFLYEASSKCIIIFSGQPLPEVVSLLKWMPLDEHVFSCSYHQCSIGSVVMM